MDARALPRRLIRSRWSHLAVVAVVLIAWAIFLRGQLIALKQQEWQIQPVAFAIGILWGGLYFGGLAFCWAFLLRHFQYDRTARSLGAPARIWLYSMSTRYIPGNIWHILSRVALAGALQIERSVVLASAAIEQILTLLGALLLIALTLPFWPTVAPEAQWWLLGLLPLGLLLLHPRIFGTILAWLSRRLRRPELAWQYRFSDLLGLVLAYCSVTICAGLALYTILWSLTPVMPQHLLVVLGAAALAWTVGFLSFLTPSGLGVREAVLVTILAQIFPLPVAVVASLLHRLVLTLGEFLAVGVAWGYGRLVRSRI